MTSCCDDYGTCTRGKDCPARPAMLEIPQPTAPAADLARRANERIRRLEAGRAHLTNLSAKPSLRIRAWDWIGNLPHRFGRWVNRSPLLQMAGFAVGAVAACALAALVVMR